MSREPRHTPKAASDGPFETDEDLGIGEELDLGGHDGDSAALAALVANPAFAKLIDAAVAARMAQLGAPAAAAPANTEAFSAFTETLKHLIDAQSMQLPGYQKPLPADEIDRRLRGKVEMLALLADYEKQGDAPLWEVGEGGFFECTNALEFGPGQLIRTFLPPPEDFVPQNEAARKVHAAMMQWIGGPTPSIGEQVQAAHIASKQPPLISGALQADRRPGLVEVVDVGAKTTARPMRRSMGSIVPERREIGLAERAAGPSGPVFVGAEG